MRPTFSDFESKFPNVSRETYESLCVYEDMFRRWNTKINLVSKDTLDSLWQRHLTDSLQIRRFIPDSTVRLADIGSGGGFPGIPIAISLVEADIIHHLVDSDLRKCEFLRTVARTLTLKVRVENQRVEKLPCLAVDVLTARALAPLKDLLGYADRHLSRGGQAIFLKGAQAAREIEDAQKLWSFTCERHESLTDPDASVLVIGDINRV